MIRAVNVNALFAIDEKATIDALLFFNASKASFCFVPSRHS